MSIFNSCLHDPKYMEPVGATSTEPDASIILQCAICNAITEAKLNFRADLKVVGRALEAFLNQFSAAMAPLAQAERDLDASLQEVENHTDLRVISAMSGFIAAWQRTVQPLYEAQDVLNAALVSVFASLPKFEPDVDPVSGHSAEDFKDIE
jgi:hypothetical protein